jgi:enoyl-CoA hydratase/3-hydroxyacyl-CoA dehydrogenase
MSFSHLGVVGAGNMGSGIAQKMAAEGFSVTLVDIDDARVARGLDGIHTTLAQGIERRILTTHDVHEIAGRIHGTTDLGELAQVDLVVEAVFEEVTVKQRLFEQLEKICRVDAVLATNTSSFSVTELAAVLKRPERMLGLHYFFHPAKNRLVEVIPGALTQPQVRRQAWLLQEALGKTAIASRDSYGFIVNRFFVPWLMHAVRLLEEGVADATTIEEAAKETFGIGMGPFELMNITGTVIALHASTTLGNAFGPFYAPPALLRERTQSGESWALEGTPDRSRFDAVADRLRAVVFFIASALVDEGVGSMEDTDIGARVGLRWRRGPFELMNELGVERAAALVASLAGTWSLEAPRRLRGQGKALTPFEFALVTTEIDAGVATITINRPDAMNALNEVVVSQLASAFRLAVADPRVTGIVIAGRGKAFVAGADIRFFVRTIEQGNLEAIVRFTRAGQDLLREIEASPKPVIARLHGLALGGGLELALACHAIVASPKAAMAFPETGIGIYPGLGGTQRTTRRVGTGLAKWLVFTGSMLTANQAVAIGLIDRVVPHEALDETIAELIAGGRASLEERRTPSVPDEYRPLAHLFAHHDADTLRAGQADAQDDKASAEAIKRLRSKAPIALRIASDLIDRGADLPLDEALDLELDHVAEIFATKDAYEGLSSLGKKTKPIFEGR